MYCCVLTVGHFDRSLRGSAGCDCTEWNCILSDMTFVCWQDRTVNRLEIAVAMNNGCYIVGLRKQHLQYHNSWDCWYFILLVCFRILHCVDVGSV
jgi:hypothetical protein